MTSLAIVVAGAAALLLIPATVFFVECVASLFLPAARSVVRRPGASALVLIPAHDEARGVGATVEGVRSQLAPGDAILVVADNCTDDTAARARAAGAQVIERTEPDKRGKGYALTFGVNHLRTRPPDVVIVLDADCRLTPKSIDALVERAIETGRPVQADYTFQPAERSAISMLSSLATVVRNRVRPRGLRRLGQPCHLTGTGMAFPWGVIRQAPELGAHLVEDLAMGIELALEGHAPVLCIEAGTRSELPTGHQAALQQRRRWEHGQLATSIEQGPRLVGAGIRRCRLDLIALGMDLMVPPLALLVGLLVVLFVIATFVILAGGPPAPAWIAGTALALVTAGVLAGWARYGRQTISARYLLLAPLYMMWKIPLYLSFLLGRRENQWKRTER